MYVSLVVLISRRKQKIIILGLGELYNRGCRTIGKSEENKN
jgi:hypothetical protein